MFDNLTEELLLTLKCQNSFLICKTFFPETVHDRLEKFRKFLHNLTGKSTISVSEIS